MIVIGKRVAYMTSKKILLSKCGVCKRGIYQNQEYYALLLHREIENEDNEITVIANMELVAFHIKCYEELQQALKLPTDALIKHVS